MDALVALALSIGVLIAGWTYVALGPGALPVWAGIVAWGCFFAAGGKTEGLTLWNRLGGGVPMLSVLVGAAAVAMVLQAKISLLGFIPGAFLGAATAVSVVVGASGTWSRTILALLIGAILGYLSEMLAGAISKPAKAAA